MVQEALTGTRTERRRRHNREALVEAGYRVMSEKGIDAATMQEIAELADLGAGTVYNYFASKDDLAIAVLEKVMLRQAERIRSITQTFSDPAQCFAFGCRAVMRAAVEDRRWRQLLKRSEVIADAIFRVHGPFAIADITKAKDAGRFKVEHPALAMRLASHALVGFGLAVANGEVQPAAIDEAVVDLLGLVGVDRASAWEIARRPAPELPPE